jgi:hypothetical protein
MSSNDNFDLLNYLIEQEKEKKAYHVSEHDSEIIVRMLKEINRTAGVEWGYLAELANCRVKGTGEIIRRYIDLYDSEAVRSYLLHHMVFDRITDCDKLIYQLYLHFKTSKSYIPPPDQPGPAAITVSYDNAFKRLKPKKIKEELLSLAYNPRDVFYLPFTMRMLASWKIPELECLFAAYLDGSGITPESVGLSDQAETYHPPLSYIKRELKFTAIDSLKYYPSKKSVELIENCINGPDRNACSLAKKSLNFIEKHYSMGHGTVNAKK